MDTSALRKALVATACLLASASFVACSRSHESAGPAQGNVGDDLNGVAKSTEKAAKDIGRNLENATNHAGDDAQDAWITTKVKSELTSAGLDPFHLHVDTDHGVVTLSGTVTSSEDAHKAVSAAKAVTGVHGVQDHLFVKPAQR